MKFNYRLIIAYLQAKLGNCPSGTLKTLKVFKNPQASYYIILGEPNNNRNNYSIEEHIHVSVYVCIYIY
jgi:hypothetical protein